MCADTADERQRVAYAIHLAFWLANYGEETGTAEAVARDTWRNEEVRARAFAQADAALTALQRQESADDIIERCACVASEAGFASPHIVAERIRALKSQVAEQRKEVKWCPVCGHGDHDAAGHDKVVTDAVDRIVAMTSHKRD